MDTSPTTLQILGTFRVIERGEFRTCAPSVQRVVAFLAVRGDSVSRETVAGTLWPETSPARAAARLRTTLWRTGEDVPDLVESGGDQLKLGDSWSVDYHTARRIGRELASGSYVGQPEKSCVDLYRKDLLPGWYEEWLEAERDLYREIRVHALEALATTLIGQDRAYLGILCCLESIAIDPFRDSTHVLLAKAYRAEGNDAAALRHLDEYREMIWRELGVRPGSALSAMEAELRV